MADNGKRRRRYRLEDYRTPYEKLRSLDEWEAHLKEGISAGVLAQQARRLRHRMRPAHAGRQEETAGPVPLPLVKPRVFKPG